MDISIHRQQKLNAMKVEISKAEQYCLECQRAAAELEKTEKQILTYTAYEECKISKAAEVAKCRIDRQSADLKAQVRKMHESQLGECRRQKVALQEKVKLMQSLVFNAKATMGATSSEILKKSELLSKELKALQQGNGRGVYQYSPGEVKFKIDPLIVSFGDIKLGDVEVTSGSLTETNAKGLGGAQIQSDFADDTTNTSVIAQNIPEVTRLSPRRWEKIISPAYSEIAEKNAEGMTRQLELFFAFQGLQSCVQNISTNESGSVLAVSERSGNVVHVCHRQANGEYERKFCLNVPKDYGTGPCLVTIKEDRGFFVARDRAIHMYSAAGDYLKSGLNVRCETNGRPSDSDLSFICITSTPDGRIILGDFKGVSSKLSALEIRTPDGNLIRTIPMDTFPVDIAAVDNNRIALVSWEISNVFIIDLKSGTTQNFPLGKAFQPKSVCYDKKTESLLIGGMNKKGDGVIRQYSATSGRSIAQIEQGFKNPCAVTPAGSNVLLVGDENTVQLFKMWV